MKFFIKIIAILMVLIVVNACNKAKIHNYDFRIKNNTGDKITIRYTKAFETDERKSDILPGDESVLYSETTSTNQKKVYDLYTDSITYFRSVSVIKTSTGVLTRNNMKARNEWDFTIIDDENATYTLKIDNIDF
jgi:hypothetical protein